jgi:hypothetical protein
MTEVKPDPYLSWQRAKREHDRSKLQQQNLDAKMQEVSLNISLKINSKSFAMKTFFTKLLDQT